MKTTTLIACAFLCLSSCGLNSYLKITAAFEEEYIGTKNFKQEIPFEIAKGMLIVKADIGGKERKLLLDTGATTNINSEIANDIETTKLGKRKTVDSNNNKKHIKYVKLQEVKVGGIPFHSIVATQLDLENLRTRSNVEIEGILGCNVMNKAIWQINFTTQTIIITDSRDSLNLKGDEQKINFYPTSKGVPMIDLFLNDTYIGEAALDTGFNGALDVNMKHLPANAKFIEKKISTTAMHGSSKNTKKFAQIGLVKMGQTFQINNVSTSFSNDRSFAYIGTKFLKDYIVTIDWTNFEMLLSENPK